MPFDVSQVDTDPVVLALMRAKRRIEDANNWCQGQGSNGRRVCALVALSRETHGMDALMEPLFYLRMAGKELYAEGSIVGINDVYGHAAVMQVYDRAIALRRAEEARRG